MYLEKLKPSVLRFRELLSLGVYFKVIHYPNMFMRFKTKKKKWPVLLVKDSIDLALSK